MSNASRAPALAAAMNPCPSGYWGDPVKECSDSLARVVRYQNRISGPLLDRMNVRRKIPESVYDAVMDYPQL